uniref:RING-type domain-containing protein n=1 Tax=Pyrodinium bahamense TaxID=73915 RepID=A0A7S0B8F4_9DINO
MQALTSVLGMVRRGRPNAARPRDPFGLDGELFEYLTHAEQHGEAFVGYRVRGHPMVLFSEDGTALASLHLRATGDGAGSALIARRPDDPTSFLGVLTTDGQAFALVMTNLTTDGVMMMDVGGEARHREPRFWEKTDKSFWSGQHRNDNRLNRSNILWPMTPNVCQESFLHFQQTGASRQLRLLARNQSASSKASPGGCITSGDGGSFPLFVYPKYGSRAAARFARTTWACPETVVIVGTPALLDGASEDYNIQLEHPLSRRPGGEGLKGWEAVVKALADSFGVSPQRLLEVSRIDRDSLAQLPDDIVHELVLQQLNSADIRKLMEEGEKRDSSTPQQAGAGPAAGSASPLAPPVAGRASTALPSAASQGQNLGSLAAGATPAEVVAGKRLLGHGISRLLIEKFEFERPSTPVTLHFGVHERLKLSADEPPDATEVAELRQQLSQRIDALSSGRREALMEDICSVYETAECVICLSSDPRPDAVLYQCGHRCLHLKCIEAVRLRRCPICRAPIAAVLPE